MADDADLAAIRDWVAQGGRLTVDKEGNPVLPTGVLPAVGSSMDETPTQPSPAAPAASTPAPPETVTQPQKQAKANQKQPTPKTPMPPKPKKPKRDPWFVRLSDWVGERAASAPTPGGNLALVLLLLFFAFAIIPVNAGKTRLQLIWLVLTGGAELPGQGAASGPTTAASEVQAGVTGAVLNGTGLGNAIGAGLTGGLIPALSGQSGGGPGGPNAAGYIPPSQLSGAGGLLEPPR